MSRALEHPRMFDDFESLGCSKVHIKRSWNGRSDLPISFVVMNNVTWRTLVVVEINPSLNGAG
ncbi:hypothetical protein BELL_0300g00140 [Botrytis elliptica]|uniref:Uncharacterized protein n=1 Tax=Botrytis elliptica TaxID=278938 RepID=A0A4Z1JKC8_9HELO|nr:hypothetical protein BELL_0300g00140 [Botrytis elliptica]